MGLPRGHRKTTTLVAGLRMTAMVTPMVLDGPINCDWFEAYVAQALLPELRPGDVVTMDNLSSHKRGANRSKRPVQLCAFFRPTVLTSIRSKRRSPVSKLCSERSGSEPHPACGT